MSTATVRIPEQLADLAEIDIKAVCVTLSRSRSWVLAEVAAGRFPQPRRYGSRCTRWSVAAIKAYLQAPA